MKKFYTLALVAATAATSWAATEVGAVNHEVVKTENATVNASVLKAASISSAQDLVGTYAWNYVSLLDEDKGPQQSEIQILVYAGMAEGDVLLQLPQGYLEGKVDVEAGTITILSNQYITLKDNWQPIYFYVKARDAEGNILPGAAAESTVGTIDGYTITFPEETVWAMGNPNSENDDYMFLGEANKLVNLAGGGDGDDDDDFEAGWTDYCTGKFIDGWIICAYYNMDADDNKTYYDPQEWPWEVTVQQNDSDPNLFRIYDPYNASTRPLNFGSGEKGAIVFSIEDPDCVLVYPDIYSGYTLQGMGINCFNLAGFYASLGYDKEYIESNIEDYHKSYVGENIVYFNQCRLNYPGYTDQAIAWPDRVDAMCGSITMPTPAAALENVAAEAENAPAEYYNLQGVPVSNPANGNIYIVRRGTKTSKVLLK